VVFLIKQCISLEETVVFHKVDETPFKPRGNPWNEPVDETRGMNPWNEPVDETVDEPWKGLQ